MAHAKLEAGRAEDMHRIRREIDVYNRQFLKRFYEARAATIMQSGDPVRIRLYQAWLAKEAAQ